MKLKTVLRSRKGMTMVAVLVAFVILMILSVTFYRVAVMSQQLAVKSDQQRRAVAELTKQAYLQTPAADAIETATVTATGTNAGNTSFTLPLGATSYTDGSGITLYAFCAPGVDTP